MRKRVVVGAGVVVLMVALLVGLRLTHVIGGKPASTTYLTATAAVTDVVDTVSVTGSVQPVETYAFAFGQAPTRNPKPTSSVGGTSPAAQMWTVKTVLVKAGDAVAAGEVMASADTADAEAALATAKLNLSAAQAKLDADSTPVSSTTTAKAKLAITQANKQLSQAQTAQSQTAAGGRLAVSQAQGALADAQQKLADDRAAKLPDAVLASDQAVVTQAERALATAKQQSSTANTQAAAAVETARLNVQSAQLGYQATTTVNTDAAIAADKATVSQAQTAVTNAQTTLERLTLTSPIEGTVSSVTIEPGDVVSGTVITIRSASMEVDASVTETDLPGLKVGQPAAVAIGALGDGASTNGTVSNVDLANATKSASGVVSYAITIALPNPPAGAAPSMTADVDVTTATASSVVAVPVSAIGGKPGAYTLQVLDGPGSVHTAAVDVGLVTSTLAEIKSGIAAGTQVVTGVANAQDLVTTFPTGPGGGARTPAPAASGQ